MVKSSKKGQILYEKILKNRNPEKKRNYEQYKTFRIFEKEISAKLLFRSYWNIISNKRGMLWKKLLDTKNAPLFISVKNRKIVDKKEIAKTFTNYLINGFLNSWKQNDIPEIWLLRRSLPQYHQSYGHRTGKCICETQNKQKLRVWWYIGRYCQRSFLWNICYSETCFQDLFSKGNFPR